MKCYIVKGKTIWKVYDPRYMTKRRPVLPRAACTSLWDWVCGRPSPSKVMLMMVYGDLRYREFENQLLRYRCWQRKLTKKEWRLLKVRIKNNARTNEIFDMLYPEKINPVRELIRTTDPYMVYSKRTLIEECYEGLDERSPRSFAEQARFHYCMYGTRGHYREDKEPNTVQSWDMTKDLITIEYNDAGSNRHKRVYSWEDFARELADMIRSGEYKDDSGD